MSAASTVLPHGPGTVFRPRIALYTSIAWSVLLVGISLFGYFSLEPSIRAQFTPFQWATLLFFIFVMIAIMVGIGFSSIAITTDGFVVRNAVRRHAIAWHEIDHVQMTPDDAFAFIYLTEEAEDLGRLNRYQVLGIQRVDGRHAQQAAVALRAAVEEHR